jgi:deltex
MALVPTDWTRTEFHYSTRKLQDLIEYIEPNRIERIDDCLPDCSICIEPLTMGTEVNQFPVAISKCLPTQHLFHLGCIRQWIVTHPVCPMCRQQLVICTGYQPITPGSYIRHAIIPRSLPGHDGGTIIVRFYLGAGRQDIHDPLPGSSFKAMHYHTYLPDNSEGQEMLKRLQLAWNRRLLFRIGYNPTTKRMDMLVVNGLELKSNTHGGILKNGYPDPSYMSRLKHDFREIGIY